MTIGDLARQEAAVTPVTRGLLLAALDSIDAEIVTAFDALAELSGAVDAARELLGAEDALPDQVDHEPISVGE